MEIKNKSENILPIFMLSFSLRGPLTNQKRKTIRKNHIPQRYFQDQLIQEYNLKMKEFSCFEVDAGASSSGAIVQKKSDQFGSLFDVSFHLILLSTVSGWMNSRQAGFFSVLSFSAYISRKGRLTP